MRSSTRWVTSSIARSSRFWIAGPLRRHRVAAHACTRRPDARCSTMSVPVPKYYIITNVLRQAFAKFERGDRVPSEIELAAQFSVSRVTIQRALTQLVDDGAIIRLQGKGTFYAGKGKKGAAQAISGAL